MSLLEADFTNNWEFVEKYNLFYAEKKGDREEEEEELDDWDDYSFELGELHQKSPDTMALGKIENGVVTNVTQWFKCREFFNDIILYNIHKFKYTTRSEIYNLYLHTVVPIGLGNSVLLIKIDSDNRSNFKDIVAAVEKRLGTIDKTFSTKSSISLIEEEKTIVVHFDKLWISNSVTFSFFTRELRWGVLVGADLYNEDLNLCDLGPRERECFGWKEEAKGSLNFYENHYTMHKVYEALYGDITEKYTKDGLSSKKTHSFGIYWYLYGLSYIPYTN